LVDLKCKMINSVEEYTLMSIYTCTRKKIIYNLKFINCIYRFYNENSCLRFMPVFIDIILKVFITFLLVKYRKISTRLT